MNQKGFLAADHDTEDPIGRRSENDGDDKAACLRADSECTEKTEHVKRIATDGIGTDVDDLLLLATADIERTPGAPQNARQDADEAEVFDRVLEVGDGLNRCRLRQHDR
ncbi:hypothetical protein D3C71_1418490 [compost metagenome]